ncbi:MAG: hypothetical protein AB7F35_05250 [Acetobacteraceae bacterium]|nr:hypothetical protein [Pseudomonadales bacterium]
MAACSNGSGLRRRWFLTLSLVAAAAVIGVALVLWQAVELSSLAAVSEGVDRWRPLLGGLRLALIGALAVVWPWLSSRRSRADDEPAHARWMALRWRVVGWLLVIELIIGQNLLGRFFSAAVHLA